MSNSTELNAKAKFGLKSFITVIIILFAVLFFVGILTYIIPAGKYLTYTCLEEKAGEFFVFTEDKSLDKQIIENSFTYLTSEQNTSRLPFYRWLTAPFEDRV